MIRFFCQYNYGGYSIFPLLGHTECRLIAFDATQNNYIPQEAITLFNRSGIKALYEWIGKKQVLFSYKYIPATEIDSTGRRFECAFQVVGDNDDKSDVDKIVSIILKDASAFERLFPSLFYVKDGLFFKADKFHDFIEQAKELSETLPGGVLDIIKKRSPFDGVIILVPKHAAFLEEKAVRMKVLEENKIPVEAIKHAYVKTVDSFGNEEAINNRQHRYYHEEESRDKCDPLKRILRKICIPFVAIASLCFLHKKRNNKQ